MLYLLPRMSSDTVDMNLSKSFAILNNQYLFYVEANYSYLSRVIRKPNFCICENKGTDQLCGNLTADQHLCFRHIDSTIPLLPKSEIPSH